VRGGVSVAGDCVSSMHNQPLPNYSFAQSFRAKRGNGIGAQRSHRRQ
jgi:hypothetical protein